MLSFSSHGNHDQARLITRFCSDKPEYRARSAKLLALLQASLVSHTQQGEMHTVVLI